jgi:hypothetical protein
MQAAILNVLVLFAIVTTGSNWRAIGNKLTPWERGQESVPCYYWKIIQLDGETKLAYMLRFTKRELIDRKPEWLEIKEGKLFVNSKQIEPKPNQVQIVFAEDDQQPKLIGVDKDMAKEMLAVQGAAYPVGSKRSETTEKICKEVEQFWFKIEAEAKQSGKEMN